MDQRNPFLDIGGLDWARQQLSEAGYADTNVAHLTRKVHEVLFPYAATDPERTEAAMPVLAQLLQGGLLGEEFWTKEKLAARTHVWRSVMPNSLHPGDVVRVRADAYTGQMSAHNGKTGRVAALRGGIVVNYDDEVRISGTFMGVRHDPEKLERQVRINQSAQAAKQTKQ